MKNNLSEVNDSEREDSNADSEEKSALQIPFSPI